MKTRIVTVLLVFAFLLSACLPEENLTVTPADELEGNLQDSLKGSSDYTGGYGIGSDIAYSMESPIVFDGDQLNLAYQIGVNGESSMRLMLFVDGAPQQFYLDANGSQLTLGENGTAWMAEVVDSGDELQPVSLKFEPNIGQAGQTLCMLPVALVDAGYPAELNPNGLGEQELVVVSPQPLMIKTETDAEVAIDAHPIEFVESQEDMAGDETGARVFVYDGVTLPVPTLQAVDGNLNVHLRLNNPSYAYRISLFLNGEPVLLDGQLSVMVESTQEAVLLEYNIDVSKAPAESLIFAVAIPVGQACMRASNLAHVSQIKTVINDLAELSQSKK